jgi:hypothetical protein
MTNDLLDRGVDSLRQVLTTMIGTDVFAVDTAPPPAEPSDFVSASVSLTSPLTSTLTLGVSLHSAQILVGRMAGLDTAKVSREQALDGAAEILNIVIGGIKMRMAAQGLPFVHQGIAAKIDDTKKGLPVPDHASGARHVMTDSGAVISLWVVPG